MKRSIYDCILDDISDNDNAKQFFDTVSKRYIKSDTTEAGD